MVDAECLVAFPEHQIEMLCFKTKLSKDLHRAQSVQGGLRFVLLFVDELTEWDCLLPALHYWWWDVRRHGHQKHRL